MQQPLLNIATRAAHEAGKVILRALNQGLTNSQMQRKGKNDYVTEVDRQAEAVIIDIIRRSFPHHAILAEESGVNAGDEYEWLIDPIDGTTNFMHRHPHFSVSIAVRHKGVLLNAVVYDPLRAEFFTVTKGSGALLNEKRIRVSETNGLADTLIGTGFPFKNPQYMDNYLQMFRAISGQVADIRRAGSAALDLAYVACGRLDGFWEIGLKPWDIAAGVLLVQEAGGLISDFVGGMDYFSSGNVVVGNPRVFKGLLQAIHPCLSEDLKK